mgnify:CR=1 FL=1
MATGNQPNQGHVTASSSSLELERHRRRSCMDPAVVAGRWGARASRMHLQATGVTQVQKEVVATGTRLQPAAVHRDQARCGRRRRRDSVPKTSAKFPDKNLAEALQRVPGVVISREFGEGERVNIRAARTRA